MEVPKTGATNVNLLQLLLRTQQLLAASDTGCLTPQNPPYIFDMIEWTSDKLINAATRRRQAREVKMFAQQRTIEALNKFVTSSVKGLQASKSRQISGYVTRFWEQAFNVVAWPKYISETRFCDEGVYCEGQKGGRKRSITVTGKDKKRKTENTLYWYLTGEAAEPQSHYGKCFIVNEHSGILSKALEIMCTKLMVPWGSIEIKDSYLRSFAERCAVRCNSFGSKARIIDEDHFEICLDRQPGFRQISAKGHVAYDYFRERRMNEAVVLAEHFFHEPQKKYKSRVSNSCIDLRNSRLLPCVSRIHVSQMLLRSRLDRIDWDLVGATAALGMMPAPDIIPALGALLSLVILEGAGTVSIPQSHKGQLNSMVESLLHQLSIRGRHRIDTVNLNMTSVTLSAGVYHDYCAQLLLKSSDVSDTINKSITAKKMLVLHGRALESVTSGGLGITRSLLSTDFLVYCCRRNVREQLKLCEPAAPAAQPRSSVSIGFDYQGVSSRVDTASSTTGSSETRFPYSFLFRNMIFLHPHSWVKDFTALGYFTSNKVGEYEPFTPVTEMFRSHALIRWLGANSTAENVVGCIRPFTFCNPIVWDKTEFRCTSHRTGVELLWTPIEEYYLWKLSMCALKQMQAPEIKPVHHGTGKVLAGVSILREYIPWINKIDWGSIEMQLNAICSLMGSPKCGLVYKAKLLSLIFEHYLSIDAGDCERVDNVPSGSELIGEPESRPKVLGKQRKLLGLRRVKKLPESRKEPELVEPLSLAELLEVTRPPEENLESYILYSVLVKLRDSLISNIQGSVFFIMKRSLVHKMGKATPKISEPRLRRTIDALIVAYRQRLDLRFQTAVLGFGSMEKHRSVATLASEHQIVMSHFNSLLIGRYNSLVKSIILNFQATTPVVSSNLCLNVIDKLALPCHASHYKNEVSNERLLMDLFSRVNMCSMDLLVCATQLTRSGYDVGCIVDLDSSECLQAFLPQVLRLAVVTRAHGLGVETLPGSKASSEAVFCNMLFRSMLRHSAIYKRWAPVNNSYGASNVSHIIIPIQRSCVSKLLHGSGFRYPVIPKIPYSPNCWSPPQQMYPQHVPMYMQMNPLMHMRMSNIAQAPPAPMAQGMSPTMQHNISHSMGQNMQQGIRRQAPHGLPQSMLQGLPQTMSPGMLRGMQHSMRGRMSMAMPPAMMHPAGPPRVDNCPSGASSRMMYRGVHVPMSPLASRGHYPVPKYPRMVNMYRTSVAGTSEMQDSCSMNPHVGVQSQFHGSNNYSEHEAKHLFKAQYKHSPYLQQQLQQQHSQISQQGPGGIQQRTSNLGAPGVGQTVKIPPGTQHIQPSMGQNVSTEHPGMANSMENRIGAGTNVGVTHQFTLNSGNLFQRTHDSSQSASANFPIYGQMVQQKPDFSG